MIMATNRLANTDTVKGERARMNAAYNEGYKRAVKDAQEELQMVAVDACEAVAKAEQAGALEAMWLSTVFAGNDSY